MDAPVPDPARSVGQDTGQAARGKYLVELLGCGSCHTDGALVGLPDGSRRLAGSHIGIAYLRSLTPVVHQVPANVKPGEKAVQPFVYFGVYRKHP